MRRRFYWLIAIACLASILEAYSILLVFELFRLLLNPDDAAGLSIVGKLTAALGVELDLSGSLLITAAVVIFVFFVLKNLFLGYAAYTQINFSSLASMVISQRVLNCYLRGPYEAVSGRNSADLIVGVGQASYFVASRILGPATVVITEFLTLLGIAAVLIAKEPLIAIVTSAVLTAAMGAYYLAVRAMFARWGVEQLKYEKLTTKNMYESLNSLKEIKIGGKQKFFLDNHHRIRSKLVDINTKSAVVGVMPRIVSETLIVGAMTLVIVIVLNQERPPMAVLSTLGLFTFAGFRMMPSINRIVSSISTIRQGGASLERITHDLEAIPEVSTDDGDGAPPGATALKAALDVRHLGFRYPDSERAILADVSFTIGRGQFVGIVGETGAGKTTLADILLGLLKPTAGEVLFDDRPVAVADPAYRNLLGYVPQDIVLLDDSIRRNIAFAVPDAEIDDARVASALKLASIDDFVAGLPDGLDTQVGEFGSKISGGQRQRIGIARALYHNPEILIMDEATSALDAKTERQIVSTLLELRGHKTVVLIAHRLSTIQYCDQLLFLRDGTLADTGKFDELRARNHHFDEMVRLAELSGSTIDAAPAAS
jgi:ABC-type multidrug transport system fused ATPase/permease subunit